MPKKEATDQPLTPDQQLEARVDAMMAPDRPDQPVVKVSENKAEANADPNLPPLDIFANPTTAPEVPDHLLEDIESTIDEAADEKAPGDTVPPQANLDDPTTDAAVDDIVAQESDTVLANEDAATEAMQDEAEPEPRKGRHPIFWTIVFLLAVAAIISAYVLITGGNATFPGADTIQRWFDNLS
jgi:hypothetical protein